MAQTIKVPGKSKLAIEHIIYPVTKELERGVRGKPLCVAFRNMFESGFFEEKTGFDTEIDSDLPHHIQGETDCINKRLSISDRTYDGIIRGRGRDLFTLAHELGHVYLHSPFMNMVYREKSIDAHTLRRETKEIKHFENAEWQANMGAGALMMPLDDAVQFLVARKIHNYEDIQGHFAEAALIFNMSKQAAEIRLNTVLELLKKHRSAVIRLLEKHKKPF